MPPEIDDLSADYLGAAEKTTRQTSVSETEAWFKSFDAQDQSSAKPFVEPVPPQVDPEVRQLPAPKPLRRPTDDSLGRIEGERGWAGKVMQNIAEIPGQAVGGLHDAVKNAFGFIDPLANWLNDNVADLRYDASSTIIGKPETVTGSLTRSVSTFLAGFMPAMKGLKALGVEGKIAAPIAASAIADFTTRDPHEARLSDLWNQAGLPKNVLTDYLKSDPGDSEVEARFKNAIEVVGLGFATEGVLLGARALRAAKSVPGVRKQERDILKAKYGELSDGDLKLIGDPTKPMIETRIKSPGPEAGKVVRGMDETAGMKPEDVLPPRSYTPEEVEKAGGFYMQVDDVVKNGDGVQSPWLMADGKIVGTGQDHIAFAGNLIEGADSSYSDFMAKTGAVRAAFFHDKDGGYTAMIHTADGQKLTPAQLKTLKEIETKNGGPINVMYGAADGLVNPQYARSSIDALPKQETETFINFSRINAEDDVKSVIGTMADALKGTVDEARRGTISQAETAKMAESMGMTVAELLARRKGQAFNAEEALAARQLWTASGEKLLEAAKAAAGPNAGSVDQFVFRKMMATHAAIQAEVLGMRAEAGRSLAQWAIPAGGGIEKARAIGQIVDAMGGKDQTALIARRLAFLAESGASPAAIARFAERGAFATTMDSVKEAWINGLLSSPKTHAVNIMSNSFVAFQQIYERGAASAIRGFTGGEGVVAGESAAMAFGMIESVKDAFRYAAKALKTGETGWSLNKVDSPVSNAISADAYNMSRETGLGRFVDFLGNGVRVPQRLLGAEDEFFRTIGYRMELRAQALRTASQEGLTGRELAERTQALIDSPPEHLMINSADAALYNTFTSEVGAFGRAIMNLRNIDSPLNPAMFVLPFVRTPVNIARYAFERTPFAPLVSQWRADVAAGGARSDLALAKMSTGTAIMLAAMDYADKGFVTGEGPRHEDKDVREALLRQGWQPYSMKIGNKWYSYNRTDPLGMTMGFAASIAEAVKKGEIDEDDVDEWQEVTAMTIAAVSQVVISKTYLEGFAKLVETLADPKRYSEKYVDDLVASFLPGTSLNNAVKNVVDPVQREAGSPMEAVQARIAFLSKNLPPRRDLWGREISSESGEGKLYDFLSPIAVREEKMSPIDKELVRLNQGPSRIAKRTPFDGVQVNMKFHPKVYDDYVRLAGNDLKHPAWGLGAKDYLDQVVSGKHQMSQVYNILSDESRKAFISNTISDYRKLAQQAILGNPAFREFTAEVGRMKALQSGAKMPVLE